ncbi:3-hydroxyacyl-ACP dehydratase [Vibrio sp. MACH09]|uniref:ApeI family dehydratase n=1 Tax=Vibrio sp. MACH09 TaxID=3025122 RepID=UPI00279372F5|nr:3-hydroxyacyl-ACP dehydratase [Vibrio sp. MACH09]GLO61996.1 3-hydroxyacyl-ACP dehydratase [Vibrio sp. MACH09]
MMVKRKPTILAKQISASQALLELKADADILDFTGHFSHFPLLPGVSQIDWAIYYASKYLQTPTSFKGLEVLKFKEPILPDGKVTLQLTWHSDKHKLSFQYYSEQDEVVTIHSSGKIKLGESDE